MKSKISSHLSVEQSSFQFDHRLVQLWAKRYVPNLSTLRLDTNPLAVSELAEISSPAGRAKTVAKLARLLLHNWELSGIRANGLLTYIPRIVDLAQAKQLSPCVVQIYEKLLSVYAQQSPTLASLLARSNTTASNSSIGIINCSVALYKEWTESMLQQLITVLEPLLQHLRERLMLSPDPRTIGFISTQFHLSTKLLLEKLTPCEQVLLTPYFKFVEEQVCIPWQRLCQAASQYSPNSPAIQILERLLPVTPEIAHRVHGLTAQVYSDHRSRRGDLNKTEVMNSTIRDLEMFQVYLLLCCLQKNMAAIEQDLVPLCIMVFPSIGVSWELVRQMLRFMSNEMTTRLEPSQTSLLCPYTQALQVIFSDLEKEAPKISKSSRKFVTGSQRRQPIPVA